MPMFRTTFRAEGILQGSKRQTVVAGSLTMSVLVYQITGCHTSQHSRIRSHVCDHLISRVTQGISSFYLLITVERGRRACKVKFIEGVERLGEDQKRVLLPCSSRSCWRRR